MRLTRIFKDFFESEKAGGFLLIAATVVSLLLANVFIGEGYAGIWHIEIGGHSIEMWINDGLMALFFLMIGLELEREIYTGELSDVRKASLPIFAAAGGMLIPAGIYYLFNNGTEYQNGIGIPMATDIAFAIGILSLLGNRVPPALKIFLTALAVIDDLGAIVIIAVFYTDTLAFTYLVFALGIFILLIILNRMHVLNLIPYIAGGLLMWFFMEKSGVHATVAGVLLAFAIPFSGGQERSPSYLMQHSLHVPVGFIILPLFALANTAIPLTVSSQELLNSESYGIIAGLLIGKPVGILLFSVLAVASGVADFPEGVKWNVIIGAGFLGGIGFTMSIFISLLAFDDPVYVNTAKISILIASVIAGLVGFLILKRLLKVTYTE
jgi:NhaA family Na+:H+ antiporter